MRRCGMTAETLTASGARVWVGCLGCYNAGGLVGAWVDALEAEDLEPHDYVKQGTGASIPPCGRLEGADERWCLDLEGFGGFLTGECSPSEAAKVAELMAAIEADGEDLEAVSAWAGWNGERLEQWDAPTAERFHDEYAGQADSGADYAAELAEETSAFEVAGDGYGERFDISDRWPFSCIDWERAWRELELGDGYHAAENPGGGVYVFRPS